MPSKPPNPKRLALQQYWHETGPTGLYARATLRTLQFASAIICLGIFGSSLSNLAKTNNNNNNNDATASPSNTNEIFALVVCLLSVLTLSLHVFLTVKRVPYIIWDFVMCVLWAALSGTIGTIYLGGEELEPEDEGRDVKAMKAGVAFALISMVLWLLTFLQGSVWCCRARRFTRKTDVEAEMQNVEAAPAEEPMPRRADSEETTLYAGSVRQSKEEKTSKELC